MSIPTIVVYDDMGHLACGDAPPWFDLSRANLKAWHSMKYFMAGGYLSPINGRSQKEPFYLLKTPHGSVMLDLSLLEIQN